VYYGTELPINKDVVYVSSDCARCLSSSLVFEQLYVLIIQYPPREVIKLSDGASFFRSKWRCRLRGENKMISICMSLS
jgi:hypothetical protein